MRGGIREWLWILYPVAVAAFVVVSANFLLSNQDRWMLAIRSGQETAQIGGKIARIREKLAVLETVDMELESEDLKFMATAVSPAKAIWVLVAQVKSAAAEVGAGVVTYRSGRVGDVKEASGAAQTVEGETAMALSTRVSVDDFGVLGELIGNLERRLPLVKITKISFGNGEAMIEVEGAWAPGGTQAGAEADSPLPEFAQSVIDVRQSLDGYISGVMASEATESGETTGSPF